MPRPEERTPLRHGRTVLRGPAAVALSSLIALAACQTVTQSAVYGGSHRPYVAVDGKQVPLPRNGNAAWQTAVERHYATARGTALTDTVLLQTEERRVRTIVWITTSGASQTHDAGWQMASFCRRDAPATGAVLIDAPDGRQDCWAVRSKDHLFREAANPTIRALGDYLARENLVLDADVATVSFHYANRSDLLDVTYAFAADTPAAPARRLGRPRSDEPADLRRWAKGMHIQVRLGFHGLLGQDSLPVAVTGYAPPPQNGTGHKQQPTHEGTAAPQPQTRLSDVEGLVGDIPENNRATIDLLVENFDRQAFQTEFGGPYPWVRKWSRNPVVRVSPSLSPRAKAAIDRTARQLHAITGLAFEISELTGRPATKAKDPANAGSIVFLASSGDAGPGSCYGLAAVLTDGSINAGVIFASPEFPADFIEECVIEEFSQIMGPLNDTTFIAQSIFNDQTNYIVSWITWNDAIVLRTLYDERLRPGMPRERAMPIVRQIIAALVAELN